LITNTINECPRVDKDLLVTKHPVGVEAKEQW